MDHCDIEWFALETNRDLSVVSEIVSKYCILDSFDCVDHNKLWKILKEMGMPEHLTCLLRNLYAGQEATVRTGHGTADSFQIGKGSAYLTYMQSTS